MIRYRLNVIIVANCGGGGAENDRAQNRGVRSHFVYIYQTAVPFQTRDFRNGPSETGMYRIRAPVSGRHQFFGTSEHFGKAHGSLLS